MKNYFFCLLFTILPISLFCQNKKIDRQAVVQRHTIVLTKADTLASLSVGNGVFAFTVDITGLQTFPDAYAKGIPLGTQSEWGWHSFPNTEEYKIEESLRDYDSHGRKVPYAVQSPVTQHNYFATNYLRQNPHRLQLGNLGFDLRKKDGSEVTLTDIKDIRQTLDMWTGELKSHFTIEGETVDVTTFCHQYQDLIAVKVKSNLVKTGQIHIRLRFPYPTDAFLDEGNNYKNDNKHTSAPLFGQPKNTAFMHQLDKTRYFVYIKWNNHDKAASSQTQAHDFILMPSSKESRGVNDELEFTAEFTLQNRGHDDETETPDFTQTAKNNKQIWQSFWKSGGAIDFSETTDARAFEIERRVVLSQYLTKIQCTGAMPPQETGLTYNSWYGKPHLEMHWWHGVHFAQWGRPELMENSLRWYFDAQYEARTIAKRQGFDGIRWQKMTDPNGREAPSSIGAFLIWQQPHFIYFAEQAYQAHPNKETLKKYQDLVFKTADFMASYAYFDSTKQRYILGTALIPAQEVFKAEVTFNPTYELAYWYWGLSIAQKWLERAGYKRDKKYDDVMTKLSDLPVSEGVYLATESATDSYTNEKNLTDHPSVLGAFGMLPATPLLDKATMQRTFEKVLTIWHWDHTWGWDFPMTAMTATRLGLPEKAVDALLMPVQKNTYLVNGHNYQDSRLRLYLPGNGGVLSAVALMCTEGGFPKEWKVKWEGLKPML